ncbi:uncharacterized protein PAC_16191 [Phialocephala subalpina]|uniref:Uncharacterized protein n=1 Tax=Phialocephala subalpina TaxID=576137 RepID=A0A1L7XML0_9HELO|nr:uncharacterized protein PAC_16191 [Phialocephala subalpina]
MSRRRSNYTGSSDSDTSESTGSSSYTSDEEGPFFGDSARTLGPRLNRWSAGYQGPPSYRSRLTAPPINQDRRPPYISRMEDPCFKQPPSRSAYVDSRRFSNLNFQSPAFKSNNGSNTVRPHQRQCRTCGQMLEPGSDHDERYPEKCRKHGVCLKREEWIDHFSRESHSRCPLRDCEKAGVDFGSNERFLQHWKHKHEDKCWYWETKRHLFGGPTREKVKWNGKLDYMPDGY